MDGFLGVIKPPGMTSSDAVLFIKRKLPRGTKVGHGGTLDPEAAGVLPICIGKATRLFDYIIEKEKRYVAELALGIETDTQDATGCVVNRCSVPVEVARADIEQFFPQLTGNVLQTPPMYSALKRDGKPLYVLARKGEEVALEARSVRIDAMEYLCESGKNRHMIGITCGKGVYIRTLMHDLGRLVGCYGHMSFLLRSMSGVFTLENSHTPEEIADAQSIESFLLPLDAPLSHIKAIYIDGVHVDAIKNGNCIKNSWFGPVVQPEELVRVYCDSRFAGIGQVIPSGDVRFRAMLMND